MSVQMNVQINMQINVQMLSTKHQDIHFFQKTSAHEATFLVCRGCVIFKILFSDLITSFQYLLLLLWTTFVLVSLELKDSFMISNMS